MWCAFYTQSISESAGGTLQVLNSPIFPMYHCSYLLMIYFKYIELIMLLQFSQLFPLCPPPPNTPLLSTSLFLYFVSVGHAYKFLGFSISHTIPNTPLSILDLPFILLNPCTFPSILPLPPPS